MAGGITGERKFFSKFFSKDDYIICADGGLKNAEYLGVTLTDSRGYGFLCWEY